MTGSLSAQVFSAFVSLFFLLIPHQTYALHSIYTIQAGSFMSKEPAEQVCKTIVEKLNGKVPDKLRVEKIGDIYSVRIGVFESREDADLLYNAIKPSLNGAVVMKAYFIQERVVSLYGSAASAEAIEEIAPAEPEVEVADVVATAEPKVEAAEAVTPVVPEVEAAEAVAPAEPKVEAAEAVAPVVPEVEVAEAVATAESKVESGKPVTPVRSAKNPKRAVGGCATAQCHSPLLSGKTVHPAAEDCEACHESLEANHPVKKRKTFRLVEEVPGLCSMCHDPAGTKRVIHPPVEDGECTTCHNPHASNETAMLTQPLAELCLMCHPDKVEHAYLHGPASAGECTLCHDPHESDNNALVIREGPELCLTCHFNMEKEMEKKHRHSALEDGCTACHDPHGSPFPKMFSVEGEKLCFQCHDEISETVRNAKVVHAPIMSEKSCVSCHSPHASDGEKLLEKSGKDLCLGCHPEVLKKSYTTLHGPIKDGTCTGCHNPHGSPYSGLLKRSFSEDFYVPYTEDSYGLCFSCHERDMLRFPDTSFATGFRDDKRNLHFLHVNRKKDGRNCTACHAVHGSEHPMLIRDKVAFGKWKFSLKFEKTETGGSCSPGCHQPFSYDRNTSVQGAGEVQPVKGK